MYIENQVELERFVERAKTSKLLAIDTEFMREKTYYAKLCLVQMNTEHELAIIDPFAVDDLCALEPLLLDENIVKLFHAARQDLEILYHEIGVLPRPLFDTQIAAALIGHVQQIGYGSLVSAVCGVKIKKADSFTDWSRRPLSESQITYAAEDVLYLPQIYHYLRNELAEKNRLSWLKDDFEALSDPKAYRMNERERFRKLKHISSLSRRQMAAAREVAAWRELQAQKRNLPRKWILTDEQIVEACRRESHSVSDLFMVRGMREHLPTPQAREVVKLITSALNSPPDTWPEVQGKGKNEPNVDIAIDLMMALVRTRARENNVAIPTLASHSDLVKVARGYSDGVEVLHGWRRDLVGNELLDLLEGKITLSLQDKNLKVTYS